MKTRFRQGFVKSIIIPVAALFLIGAVPSFAVTETSGDDSDLRDLAVQPAVKVNREDVPGIKGTSAVLMDLESGCILYEKNAEKVREPASLTKVLTCLIILEEMDLDENVTVREDIEVEGSIIGLVPGEKLTVEQLLYGMMLESGNDAAEALAFACDGNMNDFAERMNERARACGATDSNFKNPNGLNEVKSKINMTTARDMALISAEAMENKEFRQIVSTRRYTIPATNKSDERKLVNSDLCLWDKSTKVKVGGEEVPLKYEGCNGIKTGMTSDAGYCYIGSAKREDSEFLVVSMNSDDEVSRFTDVIKYWDFAFDRFGTYRVLKAGDKAGVQRVSHGSVRKVELVTRGDLAVTVNKDDRSDPGITTEFLLDEERLQAPVEEGVEVGSLLAIDSKGRLVGERTLYTKSSVPVGGPLSYVGIEDREAPWVMAGAGLLVLIIIIAAVRKGSSHRKEKQRKQEDMRSQLVKMRTAGEGMTPMEWSEITGDPKEVPIPKGPSRLTEEEFEEINKPEITRSTKPKPDPASEAAADPNRPVRHGRMSKEEIDQLLSGEMTKKRDV